jgi:hypothetical protein
MSATTGRLARAAVASLAPGALRNIIDPEHDTWVYALLAPFADAAVRYGIALAAATSRAQ